MTYNQSDLQNVLYWIQEAPFSDAGALKAKPNFSYIEWLNRGKALARIGDILVDLIEKENLQLPSRDSYKYIYALGWTGHARAEEILMKALAKSNHIRIRIEAVAALGRLKITSAFDTLRTLLSDKTEDRNVRGNACIALGNLHLADVKPILREFETDADPFVARCVKEALRILGETR